MNRPAQRFMEAVERFDRLVQEASMTQDEEKKEILLSFVVFKLHDQWNFQSCQIVLESYGGSEQEMREFLQRNWGKKPQGEDWEIAWHVPKDAIRAAQLLNVPDFVQIRDSIGSVTCADDLCWTRNAIVHSGPVALARYEEMALNKYLLRDVVPCGLLLETNARSGNLIYGEWCDELGGALRLALQ